MIKFEKVSFNQYRKDVLNANLEMAGRYRCGTSEHRALIDMALMEEYNKIPLPKRATAGSAGYDFYMPRHGGLFIEGSHDSANSKKYLIPTGIRVVMPKDVVLSIYPRSGMGSKYGMRLINTTGIIDSDYAYADNEGHILISIVADNNFIIEQGQAFAQGIFQHYLITDDDDVKDERKGGFGSTDKG